MKHFLTAFLACSLCCVSTALFAQKQANKPAIMLTDGSSVNMTALELSQSGDYRYTEANNTDGARITVRKNRVKWAWVPKPDEITKADALFAAKKYDEANTKYAELVKAYGPLGWEPYCKNKQAECLSALDKESEAIALLETLRNFSAVSPYNEEDLSLAYETLSKFYIKLKSYDKALDVLKKVLYGGDNAAVAALITRGNLLDSRAQDTGSVNDKRDAFNSFAQACLIYPKSPRAAEATFRAYQMLIALNDARSKLFADMLKKNYPKSDYVKQLN